MNTQAELLPISSTAITSGQILELDIGAVAWTSGNASTEHWQKKAVAIETVANTATEVLAIMVNDYQLWEALTSNNSATTDNGDRMLIAAGGLSINNTHTDSAAEEACFIQKHPVGAAANKKVIGWLVAGTGINSDAA